MASGWDVATKKVIRFNSRNHGANIWVQDALAPQNIDPEGHDVNDQTLADSITETLNINGINAMAADLQMGGFKAVGMAPGTAATEGATVGQITAAGGIRWTQKNVSTALALGNRFAALFYSGDLTWTLPAITGDLPATGPDDIWVFNGDTDGNVVIANPAGHLYVNGISLTFGASVNVLPGQMAVIVQTGSIEANAWNIVLMNSGDPTVYGAAWAASQRPPTQAEVYAKIQSIVTAPGTAWLNCQGSPAILAAGSFYYTFTHTGITRTLPTMPGSPGVYPNAITLLNGDISGANTITLAPPTGGTLYLDGVSLGLNATYALLHGKMVQCISIGTVEWLIHV